MTNQYKRFTRDASNKKLGGVCSGIARYLGVDPVLMRAVFLVALICFGAGILAYLILWLLMSEE